MKEKIKAWFVGTLAGIPFFWFLFWASAVDTPGKYGLIALGLAMLGVLALFVELAAIAYFEIKKDRKERPFKK